VLGADAAVDSPRAAAPDAGSGVGAIGAGEKPVWHGMGTPVGRAMGASPVMRCACAWGGSVFTHASMRASERSVTIHYGSICPSNRPFLTSKPVD